MSPRRWRRAALLAAAACALDAAGVLGHAPAAYGSAAFGGSTSASLNWSGYADTANSPSQTFSYVAGTWTVPTVTSGSTSSPSYAGFWVGLDGFNSQTVEQDGIAAQVINGATSYYAWWELYPAAAVPINGMAVAPGNAIKGSIAYLGNNEYQLVLDNLTTGYNFSITQQSPGDARSSAEWIAEAPAVGNGSGSYTIAPLANFGSITFSNAVATLNGVTGVISDFPYTQINLVPSSGLGATTSALNGAGNSFTVTTTGQSPSASPILIWDAGGATAAAPTNGSGTWDTSSTNPVWSDVLSNPTSPTDGAWSNTANSVAVFGTKTNSNPGGETVYTITLGADIIAAGIVFDSTADGSTYEITPGTGPYSLDVNGDIVVNASGQINAPLVDGTSSSSAITVSGKGTLTLSAANTYTGGTTITSGVLDLTGSLYSGGDLTVNGDTAVFELDQAAGQTIGALNGSAGTIQLTDGTLTVDSGGFFSGTITGVGALRVTSLTGGIGTPILVLEPLLSNSGTPTNNTYHGGTTVENGATLVVDTSPAVAILNSPSPSESLQPLSTNVLGEGNVTVQNGATLETINGLLARELGTSSIGTGVTINVGASGSGLSAAYEQDTSALVLTISGSPASGDFDSVNLVNNGTATFGASAPPQVSTLTLDLAINPATGRPFPADFDQYTIVKTTNTITAPYVAAGNKAYPFSAPATGTTQQKFGTTGAGVLTTASAPAELPSTTDPNFNTDNLNFYESVVPGTGVVITAQTLFNVAAYNLTPNEAALANYLDTFATPATLTVSSPLAVDLQLLSQLPTDQIGPTLETLTPQAAAQAFAGTAIETGILDGQQIFGQISNVFNGVSGFNAAGFAMLDTPNADPFTAALNAAMQSNAQAAQAATSYLDSWNDNAWSNTAPVGNSWENAPAPQAAPQSIGPPTTASALSGFLSGQAIFANLPGVNGQTPHFTTGNAIAGLDYDMASRLVLGAFFSYGYTGADLGEGKLTDHSYSPGVYVGLRDKRDDYVSLMGSYTYNDYTLHRDVFGGTASSSPAGNEADLNALAGLNWGSPHSNFKWGPAAGLGYTYLNVGSYTETGSPFDLSVSAQTVNSLRSLLGGQFGDTWHWGHSPLPWSWNVNAFWQHEFLNNSQGITASFTGLGGSFVVNTAAPSRDSALLGGGVNGYLTANTSLFVSYEAQLGARRQLGQSIMLGLAIALK